MVISFTCNNIGTGGAERVISSLANQMARDGHIVRIICYEKMDSFYYKLEEDVSIVEIDPLINKRKSWIKRKMAGIFNLHRLYKALEGTDIVVSFYTKQNCYSILTGHMRHIPVVCAERDCFFMSDGAVNHRIRKLFYPHADGFIHQTNMAREWLREKEGVKCDDIVVPNPLWMTNFPERKPIPGRVVAVGRLAEVKNYKGMIEAFSLVHNRCPSATLHIYGEGSSRQTLESLINRLNLNNVVHLEGITIDVTDVLRKAEAFVIFSHGEGYPNALMEALAMGVPSVSSDCPVGGPRDMIVNGESGFLVESSDKQSLANRIVELLDNSELRDKFSSSAKSIRKTNEFELIYTRIMGYLEEIKNGKN